MIEAILTDQNIEKLQIIKSTDWFFLIFAI